MSYSKVLLPSILRPVLFLARHSPWILYLFLFWSFSWDTLSRSWSTVMSSSSRRLGWGDGSGHQQFLNLHLLCLLYWQVGSLPLSHQGSPYVSADVPVLGVLYKWNRTICDLLCLASLTRHDVFKIHLGYRILPLLHRLWLASHQLVAFLLVSTLWLLWML